MRRLLFVLWFAWLVALYARTERRAVLAEARAAEAEEWVRVVQEQAAEWVERAAEGAR